MRTDGVAGDQRPRRGVGDAATARRSTSAGSSSAPCSPCWCWPAATSCPPTGWSTRCGARRSPERHRRPARLRQPPAQAAGAGPRRPVPGGADRPQGPGYVLRVDADAVDAWRFERLLQHARRPDRPRRAGRGADWGAGAVARPGLRRLRRRAVGRGRGRPADGLREVAREQLLAARLGRGESAALVPELETLVAATRCARSAGGCSCWRSTARTGRPTRWRAAPGPQDPGRRARRRPRPGAARAGGRGARPVPRAGRAAPPAGRRGGAHDAGAPCRTQRPPDAGPAPAAAVAPATSSSTASASWPSCAAACAEALAGRAGWPWSRGRPASARAGCSARPADGGRPGRDDADRPGQPAGAGVRLRRGAPAVRARARRPRAPARRCSRCGRLGRRGVRRRRRRRARGRRRLVRRAARALLADGQPRRGRPAGARRRRPAVVRHRLAAVPRLPAAPARGAARAGRGDPAHRRARTTTRRCWPSSPTTSRRCRCGPSRSTSTASRDLVRHRLGEPADAAFIAACHRTTSGNPLLLRQLLRALEGDGVRPDASHADTVTAIGSRAVSSMVLMRLAGCRASCTPVARAIAVLGDGAELPAVAALAGLPESEVAARRRAAGPRRGPARRLPARVRAPAGPRRRLPRRAAGRAGAGPPARRPRARRRTRRRASRSPRTCCRCPAAATQWTVEVLRRGRHRGQARRRGGRGQLSDPRAAEPPTPDVRPTCWPSWAAWR